MSTGEHSNAVGDTLYVSDLDGTLMRNDAVFSEEDVKRLKELLPELPRYGFKRLVVFGDGLNDIPMFQIANEAYAVANALSELKQIATGVIGRNEEDAVANYIRDRIK